MGLEPTTSAVTGRRSNQLNYRAIRGTSKSPFGGNNRARTYDPLLVRQMLSQLSYAPEFDRRFNDDIYYTLFRLFCQVFLQNLFNIFLIIVWTDFDISPYDYILCGIIPDKNIL